MMMSLMENMWGTTLASILFFLALARPYLPMHQLETFLNKKTRDLLSCIYPYIQINIHEYTGERFKRSEAYIAIKTYLAETTSQHAKRLKAEVGKDSTSLIFSMDELEQVTDEFKGAKLWWSSTKVVPHATNTISFYPAQDEARYFTLTFHRRHRELVTKNYMPHVIREGKAVMVRNRQRRLYTNSHSHNWYGYKKTVWNHVMFEHPATFETLAMDPEKKQEIMEDLATFRDSKDYYAKIGKAWKRGYLLHGPPGTGKSTMIAAMANYLDYDVYDIELTAVKDNSELRKLLIETSNKSIMVIEDIDCSLDLAGSRKKKDEKKTEEEDEEKKKLPIKPDKEDESSSKVTLSGLLNFIDGLWSACGGERIIVFTTNHLDKLDPALIRTGRMDKHIELSYCTFEGFKDLAKNYLGLHSHPLFETVQQQLMQGCKITPADVAEKLMPKKSAAAASATEKVTTCLKNLIQALQKANEDLKSKEAEEAAAAAAAQLKENGILETKKDLESIGGVVQLTENGN
ncbi:hypothetical protein ACLOJK_028562 [Asimina triloba]